MCVFQSLPDSAVNREVHAGIGRHSRIMHGLLSRCTHRRWVGGGPVRKWLEVDSRAVSATAGRVFEQHVLGQDVRRMAGLGMVILACGIGHSGRCKANQDTHLLRTSPLPAC